jgi:hypothetical protein
VYDDFKIDLLNMILHNRGLQKLHLQAGEECDKEYLEMTSYFCDSTLPKLRDLLLFTGTDVLISSAYELEL